MDSFSEARDSNNSAYRARTPFSSTSTSSADEEIRAPHGRHSGRRVRSRYRGGDYNNSSSIVDRRVSGGRRHSSDNSVPDEIHDILLPDDQNARPCLVNVESFTRECSIEMMSTLGVDMVEAEGAVEDDRLVSSWPPSRRFFDECVVHSADRQTEGMRSGDAGLQHIEDDRITVSDCALAPPSAPHPAATSGAPPLEPRSLAGTPPLLLPPRMQETEMPADPRTRLLDLVITNTTASITLAEMEQEMQWNAQYAATYGELREYLQSYQSIFVVSPVDDRVRLRRLFSIRTNGLARESRRSTQHSSPLSSRQRHGRRSGRDAAYRAQSAADRRTGKPSLPSAEALAAHIGSVSYSCIAERLDLDALETVYHRRGYKTEIAHSVLHVSSESCFDLFLFSNGAVVWWGMERKNHWMVDDDFLSASNHLLEGVVHRYLQADIEALFPIWCSYELDEQCELAQVPSTLGFRPLAVEPALDRLAKVLCFDHYLVPAREPLRSLVMLAFSHSLCRSAGVDYFEHVTKWSHRHILSTPAEFTGLLDYYSTKRRISRLEGEIAVAQLAIQSAHDIPEVLWEEPWLQGYYDLAEQQNTTESRLSWFTSRSDTLLEQLSHIKGRRYCLFMLGSDVFLIVLLMLDVIFMTSRLVAKMYF
ncbi:hypothetical protein, conserved [Leishmania tarentolae]|uniref:DUF155 domain-containing protein n=1 Tax=Leishmania tarentolae TaxID=5689 RepID=A0A640KTG1_LEITA|nr:hypothetical protein, conserved [Leishmania tarentolae]